MAFKNMDLIEALDAFPDAARDPARHAAAMASLYTVEWADSDDERPYAIGYMQHSVLAALAAVRPVELASLGLATDVDVAAVAAATGTVPLHRLLAGHADVEGRTRAMAALCAHWRAADAFRLLRGWRDELWPVYGRDGRLLLSLERAAVGLFGAARYGVHMTAYVDDDQTDLRIWVPKRAADKSTYPGMLDNTVAGGLMTGEDPFECLVREADEEASLPERVVRQNSRAVGTITYVSVPDERAGVDPGCAYVYPECQWVYDLLLPAPSSGHDDSDKDIIPLPKDGEVESFALCSVAEVRDQLARGLYKPNCAVVMIDFLLRHGLLTRDDEPDYDAIVARLHRVLPFPGPHQHA
ncbi:thiamin pyrophosphokinase-related protein [Grosmannia clavigera kw1407]|uniref:Thiamin pyrophosphokinase-related protein n=1 Tax=Grosmannia clavigera (strain kw1407 / UAMH 11150) TaxID=655863 RepID=F0XFD5_GROCL|nr:thiamine pyrophosphokinase-related protein [Grosmannia clavigera kw1407]EFX03798.1 thiamin pyrophosphokinase-related protein [Grosmannia clavigera kw1407]